MSYQKKILSKEPMKVINNDTNECVILEVGRKYIFSMVNPNTIKDKKFNGRKVEILGFSDDFCGDVIVRYLDNNRQGRVIVSYLLPYEE